MSEFTMGHSIYLHKNEAMTVLKAYSHDAFLICKNDEKDGDLEEAWEWFLNLCRDEVDLIKCFITDVYCGAKYFLPTWQVAMNYARAFAQALDVTNTGRLAIWAEEERE